MHVHACRYLILDSNQINGSFPSVVSGLSSLTYVCSVLHVCLLVHGLCAVWVCGTERFVHLLLCLRALHVWYCVSVSVRGAGCVCGCGECGVGV